MISIRIDGLKAVETQLATLGKQVPYAASRALNNLAFKANAEIKEHMRRTFQGGPTAFSLRAFSVDKAVKGRLVATVALRRDGGYEKALRHLFTSGTREWKKVEGWLRAIGLMPAGLMAVPGAGIPLDGRGNIRRPVLNEMLGVLQSPIRNLRVVRKSGHGKAPKAIGYFVVFPGGHHRLHPGIWKRIETGTGTSGAVKPMIMYVRRGHYRQFINLQRIGEETVARHWQAEFSRELTDAMRTAR